MYLCHDEVERAERIGKTPSSSTNGTDARGRLMHGLAPLSRARTSLLEWCGARLQVLHGYFERPRCADEAGGVRARGAPWSRRLEPALSRARRTESARAGRRPSTPTHPTAC